MPAISIDRHSCCSTQLGDSGGDVRNKTVPWLTLWESVHSNFDLPTQSFLNASQMSRWEGSFKGVIPNEFLHASEPHMLVHKNVNELSQVKVSPDRLFLTRQLIRPVFCVWHRE